MEERRVTYRYREYRKDPLSAEEIRAVLRSLGLRVGDVLRRRDKVFRELGLSGGEPDEELIALMADHPTLLQRPIALLDDKAVLGRPVENILTLLEAQTET